MSNQKITNWRRSGIMCNHHIVNKVRGGNANQKNLLVFDKARERAWHFLFKSMSFDEVAELLLRVSRAKRNQSKPN